MSNAIPHLRATAFFRQNGLCYYCNLPMWLNDPAAFAGRFCLTKPQAAILQCTAEHLRPLSEGGQNCGSNIVAACLFCNTRRHRRKIARAPDDHRRHVQRQLENRRWHGIRFSAPEYRDYDIHGRSPIVALTPR